MQKCKSLERNIADQESKLAKARQSAHDARIEAQGSLQEIQEARKIAAGKAFIMQSKYVKRRFLVLTRICSSPWVFAELPRSISDATQFYRAEEGNTMDKLCWLQYLAPNYPVPFTDQLKQLIELHKEAELAMKDLIIQLWHAQVIPSSYFGLVKWLVCIKGARMAFTRVKIQWAKMDAVKLATEEPPASKEHHTPVF